MPDYRLARLAYIIQFGEGVLIEASTRFDSLFSISTLVKLRTLHSLLVIDTVGGFQRVVNRTMLKACRSIFKPGLLSKTH